MLQSFSQDRATFLRTSNLHSLEKAVIELKGKGTITVQGEIILNKDFTIPAGIRLKVEEKGRFTMQNGSLLTIKGELFAAFHPVFNTKVAFVTQSVSEIKSEWFGKNETAVNNALASAGKIPVRITHNIKVNNSIIIDSYQTLLMNEETILLTSNDMVGKAVITNKNTTATDITISGGTIDGTDADSVAYDGLLFNGVVNSSVTNLSCINVHITASRDTGNIRLNNCSYVLLKNCNSVATWKMGIFILNGACNMVVGGKFYGTHDSAIGVVKSPGTVIDGLYVDNCGTSDGSNMSLSSENLLVINNTSVNASGAKNGNGITLGHNGSPASYSVCVDNLIVNNTAKGIFIQGEETTNVLVLNNTVKENGIHSKGTNSGGIAVYSNSKGHLIQGNTIIGNRLGVSLHRLSKGVLIEGNHIVLSTMYGIRNDGEYHKVLGNYLSNATNVHNGINAKYLQFENNTLKSP